MAEPNAAELLAGHVARTRFEDLPAAAVARAKVFILDSLGVAVAGATAPGREQVLSAARRWGSGTEAGLWGGGGRLPAPQAAMVNAFQMHCQEFDCVCEPAVLHPMATLLPAALAFAEREGGISGADLLVAAAVGVDVSCWIGSASTQPLRFFRPATAGGFGAAAATACLAGLDEDGILRAFGLLYAQSSGTMQAHVEAGPALPLQVGFNSRAALGAVDLALTGLPAPRGSIDGPFGYLPLMEGGFDLGAMRAGLGRTWLIAGLSHKPYPAGRATHGAIEGVTELRRRHGFEPGDVAGIVVTVPPLTGRLISRPDLPDPLPNYARLCTGFVLAKVLQHGRLDLSHFRGEALRDPVTHELARLVQVAADDNPDPNALVPQRVEVRLRDGGTLDWSCDQMLASESRPLNERQHLEKFRACCAFAARPWSGADTERLIELVDTLEHVPDVTTLVQALG